MQRRLVRRVMALSMMIALAGRGSLTFAADYANPGLLVETDELAQRLSDANVRIVDVRAKKDYQEGHIPTAVHLGFQDVVDPNSRIMSAPLLPEVLGKMFGDRGIGKDTRVILYDGTGGFRASRIFWLMEYFGHQNVAILSGGYTKWTKEARTVTTRVPQVAKANFPVDFKGRRLATADWLLDRQGDSNVVVIDVRGPGAYAKGHIPWATNIPWKGNINADKTMKSAGELNQHFASKGVTKNKNIAIHCQDGRAAAHSYFTLRLLGYPRVRSYDRSWAEWGSDNDLPKVVAMAPNPCAAKNPCNPCTAKK